WRVVNAKELYLQRERPDEIAVLRPLRCLSQTERPLDLSQSVPPLVTKGRPTSFQPVPYRLLQIIWLSHVQDSHVKQRPLVSTSAASLVLQHPSSVPQSHCALIVFHEARQSLFSARGAALRCRSPLRSPPATHRSARRRCLSAMRTRRAAHRAPTRREPS